MNILIYCYAFSPSIGGIEIVTETLARNLTKLGHGCTVTTEIPSATTDDFPFKVVRQPGNKEILKLMRQADVICNIELSMKFFLLSKIAGKPLVWVHNGYKLVCIDALGWYLDGPAPVKPWQSILFYIKKRGFVYGLKEGFKLYGRRWASANIYCNVAGSKWIGKRQPLKNQVQLYTPFPIDNFAAISEVLDKKYDFIFLGRLVREKGLETLLRALKILIESSGKQDLKLAVVGYGASEAYFKNLTKELLLDGNVFFMGAKKGEELINIISQSEIAVVPSWWEEPMGGVALQLMAAGRVMIVSKNGGLREVVGEAGLAFTNGDVQDLHEKMKDVVENDELRIRLKANRKEQLKKFDPELLTQKYVELFSSSLTSLKSREEK